MTQKYNPYLALFFFIPIFFIDSQWDGVIISYGFDKNDISGIKSWYYESSSHFQFYIIKVLFFIKKFSKLSNELIFDIFSFLSLYLFCVEIKKLFKKIFNYESYYNHLFFIILFTFPVWNFAIEVNLGLYIFCFYLAILGYNLFNKDNYFTKLIGIFIIFCSFSIKSNFVFVLALCFIDYCGALIQKKSNSPKKLFFIFFICLTGYLINSYYFPPYGLFDDYNKIDLNNFKLDGSILLNYFSFIIYYFTIPLFIILILRIKFFSKKNILIILSLVIFTGITLSPYYIVQKSADLFNFSNFESRHVFSISVGVSFVLIFFLKEISNYISFQKIKYLAYFLIFQNISLLLLSFLVKFNLSIVDKNLINNFKDLEKPKSGYVLIVSEHFKRNSINANFILYKSFNETKWFATFIYPKTFVSFKDDKNHLEKYFSDIRLRLKNDNYKTMYISDDFVENCLTIFKIEKNLSNYELIKKNYIFNQKKYFNIKKIDERC